MMPNDIPFFFKVHSRCLSCVSGGSSLNEKHAALLGLRAFVLTSPYDVPPWLPDVLMALVKAAGEPAPIKKTVR